jgi:hypothetical protein
LEPAHVSAVGVFGQAYPFYGTGFDGRSAAVALPVEKALKKMRGSEPPKSKKERYDEKMDELDGEIKRMREQRLRLERHQRRSAKPS